MVTNRCSSGFKRAICQELLVWNWLLYCFYIHWVLYRRKQNTKGRLKLALRRYSNWWRPNETGFEELKHLVSYKCWFCWGNNCPANWWLLTHCGDFPSQKHWQIWNTRKQILPSGVVARIVVTASRLSPKYSRCMEEFVQGLPLFYLSHGLLLLSISGPSALAVTCFISFLVGMACGDHEDSWGNSHIWQHTAASVENDKACHAAVYIHHAVKDFHPFYQFLYCHKYCSGKSPGL